MNKYVFILLCASAGARLLANEKITVSYDEAVKHCHEDKGRMLTIRELQRLWKQGKLTGGHSYWSSSCAIERPNRKGWDYKYGDCVTYWKPDFKYEMVLILDGAGHVRIEEPNSPEVKVVLCANPKAK